MPEKNLEEQTRPETKDMSVGEVIWTEEQYQIIFDKLTA